MIGRSLVLDRCAVTVLHVLSRCALVLVQDDIAAAADVSRPTLRPWLARLEKAGLIYRPYGERSGYTITPTGRARLSDALSDMPPSLAQKWGLNSR